ncbi:MAG: 1-acyl-sn-glycerol-3-phosphate acyltransferase [Candidatus Moranbacteria bacterium]|nr:1-acyl-sn-glycerol-3-phosphate acyltransferase [Candidatus Moranbacteria bacterium]
MESLKPGGYVHEEYRGAMRQNMEKKMAEKFREGGLKGVSGYLLEVFNVDVRYEKDAEDEERQKLNKEAGLIIANHPGGIDTPAIIGALTRDPADLKMVTTPRGYEEYGRALGRNYFIPIPSGNNLSEGRKMVQSVVEHIQDHNGIVLIYPSGRLGKSANVEFQSGFRSILANMPDNVMIYCFNFKNEETEKITRGLGKAGLYSDGLSLPLNINKLRDPIALNVAERYTQAGEWKSLINNLNMPQANKTLKEHYLKLFGHKN